MKRRFILLIVVALVLLVGPMRISLGGIASFQGLGSLPGGNWSNRATDVSADGLVVVGWCKVESDDQPFRWTATDGMQSLGNWEGDHFAYGVSADGSVIVGDGEGVGQGFRWTEAEGMVGLGYLSGMSFSSAQAVSGDGAIVVGFSGNKAFRWTESEGMTDLGNLPGGDGRAVAMGISADGSVIVGTSQSSSGYEPFRWEDNVITGLGHIPGGSGRSFVQSVSADGSTVVGYSSVDDTSSNKAFLWNNNVMTAIGDRGSHARDVSGDGSVVVGGRFIWDATNGMRDLAELLVNDYGLDLTGWELQDARGISDDGLTIVGWGINPDGRNESWIATIPEPTTLLLLGLGGIGLNRRRRG